MILFVNYDKSDDKFPIGLKLPEQVSILGAWPCGLRRGVLTLGQHRTHAWCGFVLRVLGRLKDLCVFSRRAFSWLSMCSVLKSGGVNCETKHSVQLKVGWYVLRAFPTAHNPGVGG